MAKKKGGGSSRNGRDSQAQRLGVKEYAGERVTCREYSCKGSGAPRFNPGLNVGMGTDHTLYAR